MAPLYTAPPKISNFEVVPITANLLTVAECINISAHIDSRMAKCRFLILSFHKEILVSGSFIGFLVERIQKLKKLSGRMMMVAENPEVYGLLLATNIHSLVPVFPSFENCAAFLKESASVSAEKPTARQCPECGSANIKKVKTTGLYRWPVEVGARRFGCVDCRTTWLETDGAAVEKCPHCTTPAKLMDGKVKGFFRRLTANNRFYCQGCKMSWRRKSPEKTSEIFYDIKSKEYHYTPEI